MYSVAQENYVQRGTEELYVQCGTDELHIQCGAEELYVQCDTKEFAYNVTQRNFAYSVAQGNSPNTQIETHSLRVVSARRHSTPLRVVENTHARNTFS